jgi:hypothetical protein
VKDIFKVKGREGNQICVNNDYALNITQTNPVVFFAIFLDVKVSEEQMFSVGQEESNLNF